MINEFQVFEVIEISPIPSGQLIEQFASVIQKFNNFISQWNLLIFRNGVYRLETAGGLPLQINQGAHSALYIESGAVDSLVGRLWFSWPIDAAKDGQALVRIDGNRYPRQLIRIQSAPELEGITAAFRTKYDDTVTVQEVEDGAVWVFQLAPRIEGES